MSGQTKLTLRLDSRLINAAKEFARENDRSVSRLVADYFTQLSRRGAAAKAQSRKRAARDMAPDDSTPMEGPITSSLRGALRNGSSHKTPLSHSDYHKYLEKKHQ